MRGNMQMREDVSILQLQLSDQNLQLIAEYEQRIRVSMIADNVSFKTTHCSSSYNIFNRFFIPFIN